MYIYNQLDDGNKSKKDKKKKDTNDLRIEIKLVLCHYSFFFLFW